MKLNPFLSHLLYQNQQTGTKSNTRKGTPGLYIQCKLYQADNIRTVK